MANCYTFVIGGDYTYYNGVQNYEIYDIIVMFSAQKYNPAYGNVNLAKNSTKVFCDKFSSNSVKAQEWIKEILNIYVGKATSAVLDKIPGVKYLPYELLTNGVKPQPSEISSTGNALVVTLNTTTTIKFTYVGDSIKNTWTHCLTDNMVSYAVSYTASLHYKENQLTNLLIVNLEKYMDLVINLHHQQRFQYLLICKKVKELLYATVA